MLDGSRHDDIQHDSQSQTDKDGVGEICELLANDEDKSQSYGNPDDDGEHHFLWYVSGKTIEECDKQIFDGLNKWKIEY